MPRLRSTGIAELHERLAAPGDLGLEPIQAGRGADEHPLPLRAAPVEVADALGNLDHAEVLSFRAEDPDAFGAGDPDGAALVALHPVDEIALLETPRADALGEGPPVRDGAVGADVEDADMRSRRVVDIEQRFVR